MLWRVGQVESSRYIRGGLKDMSADRGVCDCAPFNSHS